MIRVLAFSVCLVAGHAAGTLVDEVDPFIGVDGEGQTVPGAALPFGFVRLSPDVTNNTASGYSTGVPVRGFSHNHVSGTGAGGKYGNFRVTPVTGPVRLDQLHSAITNEVARPGFYAATLTRWDVRAELTATRLVGFHRYQFPTNATGQLVLDVSSVVGDQAALEAGVRIVAPDRLEGTVRAEGGWNKGPYTLHFAAVFDQPATAMSLWIDGATRASKTAGSGKHVVATTQFAGREVKVKVGLSFINPARARANIEREIPDWDFEKMRTTAARVWENLLGKMLVDGGTAEQRRVFYSALYHAHFMPHDVTGENVWWQSDAPHFEDYCAIWDTFRCTNPLWTLLEPRQARAMVQSLIDIGEHSGNWLPDARIAGNNGQTQGGSHGEVVIADQNFGIRIKEIIARPEAAEGT